jgi:DNA mismatch repair ATPase MutS
MLTVWSVVSAVITVIALFLTGLGALGWTYALVLVLSLNGLIYLRLKPALNRRLGPWRAVSRAAAGYLHAAQQAAADLPDTPELRPLQESFAAVAEPSVLTALCKRVGWADSGGMLHTLCNVVFFLDFHVARSILRCAVPNRDKLVDGLRVLADLEALNSLACFAYESPGRHPVCYATVTAERQISIAGGRHPLIPPDRVVPNDVYLRPPASTWVITRPNMAGKSTLLRMCGVNCLLAQIGTTALAERMTVKPARLITDLRIRDSLAKNESYFHAEVRHLRRMVLGADDGSPVLGLVDEPFRGTNSDEQVAASLALVEHLQGLSGFFLIATHEERLAALAGRSDQAQNHHFHEELDKAGIVFDYRLRPGPAEARNALRILEREGYPNELLKRAHMWLENA